MPSRIIQGDALTKLKELESESVNCIMTSPPYWALRDYSVEGQLGLEPTFNEYINKLCDIFDECKRVLRKDGTCWVNLGDTYYTKSGSGFNNDNISKDNSGKGINKANELRGRGLLPDKCLTMIPFQFAIEMVNRGWILRNTIIWHKRNCMPSSVKDRFTVDFEYIFFFVKSKKYWFETQREPHKLVSIKRTKSSWDGHREPMSSYAGMNIENMCHPEGRNKRTVWTINPKPFKEAHFAVYPEELCETPLKAGCPQYVCKKCGYIRTPKMVYTEKPTRTGKGNIQLEKDKKRGLLATQGGTSSSRPDESVYRTPQKQIGWDKCKCNAGFEGGVVLDPFFGSGTTGLVALKQQKKFIGIELNPDYIKIAEKRLKPYLEQRSINQWQAE